MANVLPLPAVPLRARALPASLQTTLDRGDWPALKAALAGGAPAGWRSAEGVPLLELVLAALEEPAAPHPIPAPVDLLEAFLAHGLNPTAVYYNDQATAVTLAVHYGQWAWAHRLLDAGCPAEAAQGNVLLALIQGRLQRVIRAMEEAEHTDVRPEPQAPVGNVHALPGRTPPAEDPTPESSLRLTDTPEQAQILAGLIQRLVAHGARLNEQEAIEHGGARLSPLLRAVLHRDLTVVGALVDAGADLATAMEVGNVGCRPLEYAIMQGGAAVVETLLAGGAPWGPDPALPSQEALLRQPLVLAAKRGQAHLIETVCRAMPPEALAHHGALAMHVAAAQGHVPVMRALRLQGIAYDTPSLRGYRPLHHAAVGGHEATIAFLVRRGQRWDQPTDTGVTPADVLRSEHPELLERFGLPAAAPGEGQVRVLTRRFKPPRSPLVQP